MWETNAVHMFRSDGREWTDGDRDPTTNGVLVRTGERIHDAPLLVDTDADGRLELFVGSLDGNVYAWRLGDPGEPCTSLPGWPIPHGSSGVRTSPVAADLDGDGELEIVTVALDGKVRAFEFDGTPLPGWPKVTGGSGLGSEPAVHDLDGDGLDDIVFGGTDSLLYAVSGDGRDLPGWPVGVGAKIQSSPVLLDADDDGDLEIFVLDREGGLWAFEHEADPLPGWPVQTPPNPSAPQSPAVADLDGDGSPEILVNADGEVSAFRLDGSPLPNWPVRTFALGVNSPVVADLDGDGSLDVLVGTVDHRLTAYRADGTVLPGWPRVFTEVPKATPYVADVDGDGDLDVAIGADDGSVRVVDVSGPANPGAAPWPGYHGRRDRPGVYLPSLGPPGENAGPPGLPGLTLLPSAPNPFRVGTDLRFTLSGQARVWVDLFDVTGRRVATLAHGRLLPGGSHGLTWSGRDLDGRSVPSGIYFIRLRAEGETRTGKLLRLR